MIEDTSLPQAQPLRWWKFAAKIVVTISLCAVLLWQADWPTLWSSLREVHLAGLAAVIALMFLSVTISAYKWRLLLSIHDIPFRFHDLHRWYFTAVFFNNFLPSSIGGDGFRALKTLNNNRSRACAVIAIFVERLSGLAVLLLMGYIAALFMFIQSDARRETWLAGQITYVGAAVIGGIVIVATVLLSTGLLRQLMTSNRLPARIRMIFEHFGDFRRKPALTAWAVIGVSVLFHIHTILFYWILMWSLGAPTPVLALVIMLTVTSASGLLPITINGIGLVDGVFVYMAKYYGVQYEAALSAMLLIRGINIFISVVGGYFYAFGTPSRKIAQSPVSSTWRHGRVYDKGMPG